MKYIIKIIFSVGLVVALATGANALPTLSLSGGTAGTIPSNGTNDFIGTVFPSPGPIGGYYGSQIILSGGPATLRLDYYGAEASYTNSFVFDGVTFSHPSGTQITGSVIATGTVGAANGTLDFRFIINSNAAVFVQNGSNPNDFTPSGLPNFFASFDPYNPLATGQPTSGQSVWLFLDDGASVDDNHDDFLVRISVVPEPYTLLLLGLGLVGVAGVRRFRK